MSDHNMDQIITNYKSFVKHIRLMVFFIAHVNMCFWRTFHIPQKVENIGDENSNDMAVRHGSFEVYDGNGKSISVISFYLKNEEDEFDPAELRPGGKNEGYIYIPITEGSVPAELIYFDSTNKKAAYSNQFVFKL